MENGLNAVLDALASFIANPRMPSPASIAIVLVGIVIVVCAYFAFRRPSKKKPIGPIRRR